MAENLLRKGSTFLETQRQMFMTEDVVYRRGLQSVTLKATLGKSEFEVADESGFTVKAFVHDFLITAADLILGGSAVVPKIGDQVSVTRGGESVVFEVLTLPNGECWRYSDSFGKTLRIHTRQVS
jgi:hypothetical protein